MAKFIKVVESYELSDPSTDEPIPGAKVSWKDAVRALFQDPRVTESLDVFTANDVRISLRDAKPGDVIELRDDEHAALVPICKKPRTFSPTFLFGGGVAFLRAICDAASEK